MKNKIPFLPLPYKLVKRLTDHFLGLGENLAAMFPSLEFNGVRDITQKVDGYKPVHFHFLFFYNILSFILNHCDGEN